MNVKYEVLLSDSSVKAGFCAGSLDIKLPSCGGGITDLDSSAQVELVKNGKILKGKIIKLPRPKSSYDMWWCDNAIT